MIQFVIHQNHSGYMGEVPVLVKYYFPCSSEQEADTDANFSKVIDLYE